MAQIENWSLKIGYCLLPPTSAGTLDCQQQIFNGQFSTFCPYALLGRDPDYICIAPDGPMLLLYGR